MTDRLGRLLRVTLEAARVNDSSREITAQSGLHIRRQIIEALSREHDGPGGQSDLPLGAFGCAGAPGFAVKLLGEVYRQQPDGLQQGRYRDGQFDGRRFIIGIHRRPSMSHRRVPRNDRTPIVSADG